MFLVREIMYCKPGKVRALVEKFKAMSALSEKVGMPKMRIMTDFCAERVLTVVSELEVPTIEAFENMMSNPQGSAGGHEEIREDYGGIPRPRRLWKTRDLQDRGLRASPSAERARGSTQLVQHLHAASMCICFLDDGVHITDPSRAADTNITRVAFARSLNDASNRRTRPTSVEPFS